MRKRTTNPPPLSIIQHMTRQTLHFAAVAPEARAVTCDIILALNRLAGAATETADIEQVIARLLTLLSDSLMRRAYVETMMTALNELIALRGSSGTAASPTEAARRSARRREDVEARYEVRTRGNDEMLVEIRRGSGENSSVSRRDYDAAISAMIIAGEEGQRFDDLYASYLAAGGANQIYRLRVTLRFWRLGGPPIIGYQSAHYSTLVPPQLFAPAADALWHQRPRKGAFEADALSRDESRD